MRKLTKAIRLDIRNLEEVQGGTIVRADCSFRRFGNSTGMPTELGAIDPNEEPARSKFLRLGDQSVDPARCKTQ